MILTDSQAIALDKTERDIEAVGLDLMAAHVNPGEIVRWLTARVDADPMLQAAPALRECPECYALHDVTAYRPLDIAGWPTGDDGWCSDDCQDRAAERWFARYQEVAA